MPESTVKVTKDAVTISDLQNPCMDLKRNTVQLKRGQTVQLKDADPNELQFFIENMPTSIKGKTKSMKCNSQYFV